MMAGGAGSTSKANWVRVSELLNKVAQGHTGDEQASKEGEVDYREVARLWQKVGLCACTCRVYW